MGKAKDYTQTKIGTLEVGDRTEDTKDKPLSSSSWIVFCTTCENTYIKKYESFKNLRGCKHCHPERTREHLRFKNLRGLK